MNNNMLKWPDWEVSGYKDIRDECEITAKYPNHPDYCIKCGVIGGVLKNGTKRQLFRDLPAFGKKTVIAVSRQRYICTSCSGSFVQPLPEIDERGTMTKRLVSYIGQQAVSKPFLHIAHEVGVDEKTVRNIFRRQAKIVSQCPLPTPRILGIDEVHIRRGYHCILTNLEDASIFELLENRNQATVQAFLESLPDKDTIEVVCIDMWKQFRDAVNEALPNAVVVIDRFHVVRQLMFAFEDIVKPLYRDKSIPETDRRALKHQRFTLFKRQKNLTTEEKVKVNNLLGLSDTLRAAYGYKERFFSIWDAKSRNEAEIRFMPDGTRYP